jgi:quinoprotein glucose dehydrogenase
MRQLLRLCALLLVAATPALAWEHWGGDPGGSRFSPLNQITPDNVGNLVRAWEFRTLFVVDRDTGKPVWPVEERAVPQGGAEGEQLSPTQPFPTHVPALAPQRFSVDDAFNLFPQPGRSSCEQQLVSARNEALYTPPSTQGTLLFPFTGGGVNWGSAAFDPVNQILYANSSRAAHLVKLIPRSDAAGFNPPPGHDFGQQQGAPFAMTRALVTSPLGLFCNKPPWGEMVAFDLKAGKVLWHSTVGTTEDLAPALAERAPGALIEREVHQHVGAAFT